MNDLKTIHDQITEVRQPEVVQIDDTGGVVYDLREEFSAKRALVQNQNSVSFKGDRVSSPLSTEVRSEIDSDLDLYSDLKEADDRLVEAYEHLYREMTAQLPSQFKISAAREAVEAAIPEATQMNSLVSGLSETDVEKRIRDIIDGVEEEPKAKAEVVLDDTLQQEGRKILDEVNLLSAQHESSGPKHFKKQYGLGGLYAGAKALFPKILKPAHALGRHRPAHAITTKHSNESPTPNVLIRAQARWQSSVERALGFWHDKGAEIAIGAMAIGAVLLASFGLKEMDNSNQDQARVPVAATAPAAPVTLSSAGSGTEAASPALSPETARSATPVTVPNQPPTLPPEATAQFEEMELTPGLTPSDLAFRALRAQGASVKSWQDIEPATQQILDDNNETWETSFKIPSGKVFKVRVELPTKQKAA